MSNEAIAECPWSLFLVFVIPHWFVLQDINENAKALEDIDSNAHELIT